MLFVGRVQNGQWLLIKIEEADLQQQQQAQGQCCSACAGRKGWWVGGGGSILQVHTSVPTPLLSPPKA